ncbi:hypothetical protein [Georgenia thermotolerans]|uniref:Uncharacterized protein n=1 Tax=Georgenia thermotolerans TaxID=527326 RepID=A0A7J5UQD9_9MICO|nr:hypothetical protein [Georgenia thermotolerans]KAE8764324.1 hypothetical protein GB883_09590 [Georgenia thermotolerans]
MNDPVPDPFARAQAVADAVLYEGYVLYPYRKSSPKNQVRWQFGVLAPRGWIEARGDARDSVAGSSEGWWQQSECLLEAPPTATVRVRVRYLRLQARDVEALRPDGSFQRVERLETGDRAELSFEEAVPRLADVVVPLARLREGPLTADISAPGGEDVEPVPDGATRPAGRVVRRRRPLAARVHVTAEPAPTPFPLLRLRVRTENTAAGPPPDAPRPVALRSSLVAAHTLLATDDGAFLSLLDPPAWAGESAGQCANVRTFPVLVGEPGSRDLVLSSPIILYDHPRVAPESPGDLFDAAEIDEILSLRTLTLTDAEKAEVRATDPRTAAIVDRVDTMPPEVMARLHGAIRSLRPARTPPGAESVVVAGVPVARGSRVRLHPRPRGTDAHDMFLTGRTARVEGVYRDVDDARHVAVTLEDPSSEPHRWYGRFHYFAPEEVEPLADDAPVDGTAGGAP